MDKRRAQPSLLRWERERRGWSREYVAEQLEVDVATVGRWERGERAPQPYYRQKLCTLFEKNALELGLLMDAFEEPYTLEVVSDLPSNLQQTSNELPQHAPIIPFPPSPSPSLPSVRRGAMDDIAQVALPNQQEQALADTLQQGSQLESPSQQSFALASSRMLHPAISEEHAQTVASPQAPATAISPRTSSLVASGQEQVGQKHPSRRTILTSLIAGVVGVGVGSAITWLAHPYSSAVPVPRPAINYTLVLYRGYQAGVNTVVWSPDGRRIASGADLSNTMQVWDATSGKNIVNYRIQSASVNAVAWSPDGKHIASASGSFFGSGDDHTVQIWDVARESSIVTYRGHTKEIHAVAWSPDNKYIASAGNDTTVQVWDATSGNTVYTYTGHTQPVYAVAWSSDGKRIASAGSDKIVRVWVATTGQQKIIYLHNDYPRAVAWSPDGQYIASSGGYVDATVQVWGATTGEQVLVYRGHSQGVNTIAWSPDGKHIASGSTDKTVQVWLSANGDRVFTYGEHTLAINEVTWSPQQSLIASASKDGTVRVWKMG